MSDFQEFWVPNIYTPENERPVGFGGANIKVIIRNVCQFCKSNLVISRKGSDLIKSEFVDPCSHYDDYTKVWANRVEKTFGKCTNCGEINEYQDGPFLCYLCLNNPYR